MSLQLKVKIKTLASESKIIRHEERKLLKQARYCLNESIEGELRNSSLSELAPDCYKRYTQLQQHRVTVVRNTARCTQLAYAIVRGKTYAETEMSNSEKGTMHINRIIEMVQRYSPKFTNKLKATEIALEWLGMN